MAKTNEKEIDRSDPLMKELNEKLRTLKEIQKYKVERDIAKNPMNHRNIRKTIVKLFRQRLERTTPI